MGIKMRKYILVLLLLIVVLSGCNVYKDTNTSKSTSSKTIISTTTIPSSLILSTETSAPLTTEEQVYDVEYTKRLTIAENVITEASKLYNMLYGYNRTDLDREELTNEQIENLNLNPDRMYYCVTDERFNTWNKLITKLSECFSENAIRYFQNNAPTTYFELNDMVYAVYVDAGFIGADKIELTKITDLNDDSFTVSFSCYMIDETAPNTYRCYADIDTKLIKIDNSWVLESSSDWQNDREELFYCNDVRFKAE